jgi:hypothetical protein
VRVVDLGEEGVGDAESAPEGDFADAGDGAQVDERIGVELEVSWRVDGLAPWVVRVRNTAS